MSITYCWLLDEVPTDTTVRNYQPVSFGSIDCRWPAIVVVLFGGAVICRTNLLHLLEAAGLSYLIVLITCYLYLGH